MKRSLILKMYLFLILLAGSSIAAPESVKKMVFEEQRIEGKIRRPQLVLIKAEQRPEFKPMVMQSYGKNDNLLNSVNDQIIENSPYKMPFQFDGNRVKGYEP
ncbi:MAG: hypothetical protein ACM31E_12090 [Fibrobacterota bacterium]|jgi:hypothetical protein